MLENLVLNEVERLMLEIHLFINPLGTNCLHSEKSVLKIKHSLNTKVSYRFIPLFNMDTIQQTISLFDLNSHDLLVRQKVSKIMYQIILDYMAALFQGQKYGQQYLLFLQSALINQGADYTEELTVEIADKAHLDIEMFLEDRQSTIAEKSYNECQSLAQEFNINRPNTAVLFNSNEENYGIKLNNCNYDALLAAYQVEQLGNKEATVHFVKKYQASNQAQLLQK